ncbi:putative membrane protein [Gracilibacillus ureilyticus]|uniref:Putative membrane protein n=2 Tax=Gracilibacillus ureilyticus TaxID=531814 RepID=A0A1H9PIW1_9BACI|nr:putative membrane protein [Gracilibacillus ureilyticus]
MSEPKRLHPIAMILSAFKTIRQSIFSLLPIIILAVGNSAWFYIMMGAVVFIVLIILISVLTWLRFTYQLEDDQIRIEQGIFIRKKRTISKHRIQSIDLSQNILHRLLGLTKVQIETAGSDHKIDASLHAVTMEEGKLVHDQLKYKRQFVTEEDITDDQEQEQTNELKYPSETISPKALLLAGSTSGSFGIILGLFGLAFSEVETFIPDQLYNQASSWLFSQALQVLIVLSIITLIILWAMGIVLTVIQHWNFTITRYEKELFITRGLLEKKQSTIPLKRIQAVGIKESIIRQPLGLATLYVEIASGEVGQSTETHTLLYPLIRKQKVEEFLNKLLPEYEYKQINWTNLPKRALPYYLFRMMIFPFLALIPVAIYFSQWILAPLIVTVLAGLLGYFQYKTIGYKIEGENLFIQNRLLSRDTVLVKHRRLQSFQKKQHILHRKQQLATLDTAILNKFVGRHLIVRELELDDVDRIADWYSYRDK